ncbi:hypothetical protein [Herminiimonas sp. CN]|uniref:hypothetical protein n=1 Tax=Herminiimonas sp. CN TaxID=1349818 RepID=UPI0012DF22C2|nr:hypothetical protein [Herminiimonas sp. CN]
MVSDFHLRPKGIAYGAGRFCVTNDLRQDASAAISLDGVNWIPATSSPPGLGDIGWDGTRFIAVAFDTGWRNTTGSWYYDSALAINPPQIWTSETGSVWAQTGLMDYRCNSCRLASDGSKVLIVGQGETYGVGGYPYYTLTSADGVWVSSSMTTICSGLYPFIVEGTYYLEVEPFM